MPVPAGEAPRHVEILDQSDDPGLHHRSHRDIALANRLFGGTRAVCREFDPLLLDGDVELPLLDVGTGTGGIPCRLLRRALQHDVRLAVVGIDLREELVQKNRSSPIRAVCADAAALPFRSGAFDIVLASQLLHHFDRAGASLVIRELHRVARRRVIIADLRRSWVAAAGLWLVSFPLGFHPVSRHDGVVSIRRGFDAPELAHLIREAVGVDPSVCVRLGWRVTASWSPRC